MASARIKDLSQRNNRRFAQTTTEKGNWKEVARVLFDAGTRYSGTTRTLTLSDTKEAKVLVVARAERTLTFTPTKAAKIPVKGIVARTWGWISRVLTATVATVVSRRNRGRHFLLNFRRRRR